MGSFLRIYGIHTQEEGSHDLSSCVLSFLFVLFLPVNGSGYVAGSRVRISYLKKQQLQTVFNAFLRDKDGSVVNIFDRAADHLATRKPPIYACQ